MTARDALIEGLRSVIPKSWRIVGVDRNIDVVTNTTITLSQQEIASFPQAPMATVEVKFEIKVACPYTDREPAEVRFDADVVKLLLAFRSLRTRFDPAIKQVEDSQLQYLIPVYVTAKKE
jgi:hypothetical protein